MFERPLKGHTDVVLDAKMAASATVDRTTEYEDEVHKLLEASAAASSQRMLEAALKNARDAARCERALCKYREVLKLTTLMNSKLCVGSWSSGPNQW